jgi:hypothetical protein
MKTNRSKHRNAIGCNARGGRHFGEPQEAEGGPSARILRSDVVTKCLDQQLEATSDYRLGPAGTMQDHFYCYCCVDVCNQGTLYNTHCLEDGHLPRCGYKPFLQELDLAALLNVVSNTGAWLRNRVHAIQNKYLWI